MSIISKLKYFRRYRFILKTLINYGFDSIVETLNLDFYVNYWYNFFGVGKKLEIKRIGNEKRLRLAIEELGPTFIKLGQLLSSRPDIVPKSYIQELQKLQDDVNEEDYFTIRNVIENSMDTEIENVFSHIYVKPLGTASIAQVHEAQLKTGEKVVVKVKKSNVEETIKLDLKILLNLAYVIEKSVPSLKIYKPVEITREFFEMLTGELDFNLEARSNDIMAAHFKDFKGFIVPKIYWEYTNKDIIVMEKMEGEKLADIMFSDDSRKHMIASLLARIFIKQILEKGFFHGDPHPGNIIVVDGDKIAFIDYGAVGKVDEFTQDQILDMIYSLASGNTERLISFFKRNGVITQGSNLRKLRSDIENLVQKYWNMPINKIDSTTLLNRLYDLIALHKLNIRADFFIIAKTLILADGIIRALNPDINVLSESGDFIAQLIKNRYSFTKISRSIFEMIDSYRNLAIRLPYLIEDWAAYREQQKNEPTTGRELKYFSLSFLSFGLIVAATQLLKYEVLPYFYGYSFPGVILLGFSLMMIFRVLRNLR